MYQIGDLVVYGNEGVCRIEEIGFLDIPSIDKNRLYYTLAPIYHDGKIFTPVDTTIFMRPVIKYEEAQHLIQQIPDLQTNVLYETRKSQLLSDHYESLLQTHDCADLIKLIKSVYIKRQVISENGKNLGKTDERYMKLAEDVLYGEFAVVLGIPKNDVKNYIGETIERLENNQS